MARKTKTDKWKTWDVPYRANGSVAWTGPKKGAKVFQRAWDYTSRTWIEGEPIIWKKNEPFKAALKFVEMFHGANSSTHATFENPGTGAKFVMRADDLERCLREGVLVHGVILGEWRFMRHSNRYSIVPIEFISTIDLKT